MCTRPRATATRCSPADRRTAVSQSDRGVRLGAYSPAAYWSRSDVTVAGIDHRFGLVARRARGRPIRGAGVVAYVGTRRRDSRDAGARARRAWVDIPAVRRDGSVPVPELRRARWLYRCLDGVDTGGDDRPDRGRGGARVSAVEFSSPRRRARQRHVDRAGHTRRRPLHGRLYVYQRPRSALARRVQLDHDGLEDPGAGL